MKYDNGAVFEGNIKTMQRVLGLQETGKWTATEQQKAGSLNADDAWLTPEDVTNMLKSKRVNSKTAAGIAEAVVARLNGQELTRTERERLSSALNSSAVQDVISDIMKKKSDGIDSTLKNAYDEINTIGGNKNGRETALWNLQNQRADGSLPSSQTQTRSEAENRSGVPGKLREDGSSPNETLPAAQRRGLISDLDAFSDDDYATVTEGSALHQVRKVASEGIYKGDADVIKNNLVNNVKDIRAKMPNTNLAKRGKHGSGRC